MKQNSVLDQFDLWELEAFADGVDMPHVASIVEKNPAVWQEWLKDYTQENSLYGILYRTPCPTPDSLRDYFWDFLPEENKSAIASHLLYCPDCSAELQELVDQFSPTSIEQTQPASNIGLALRNVLGSTMDAAKKQLRIVIATLASPMQSTPALAAFRSDDSVGTKSRQQITLIYHADEADITVVVHKKTDGELSLSGQLLCDMPDVSNANRNTVKLVPRSQLPEPQQSELDEILQFSFQSVIPDEYKLIFLMNDQTIVIPSLDLRHAT